MDSFEDKVSEDLDLVYAHLRDPDELTSNKVLGHEDEIILKERELEKQLAEKTCIGNQERYEFALISSRVVKLIRKNYGGRIKGHYGEDDLIQDVICYIWFNKNIRTNKLVANKYIMTIANHKLIDESRRKRFVDALFDDDAGNIQDSARSPSSTENSAEELKLFIEGWLTPDELTLVKFFMSPDDDEDMFVQYLNASESFTSMLSQTLKINKNAVAARRYRIRKKYIAFREQLDRDGKGKKKT